MEARAFGGGGARKVGVERDVRNPGRRPPLPDASRQTDAPLEGGRHAWPGRTPRAEAPGACHVPTHRRTLRARSTSQMAPYCQPSASQIALSIRGAASSSVGDSVSARAVANRIRWLVRSAPVSRPGVSSMDGFSIRTQPPHPARRRRPRAESGSVDAARRTPAMTWRPSGDGPDAIALLRPRAFDIVLLDIGLPSMSGLDVLAQARALADPPLGHRDDRRRHAGDAARIGPRQA